MFNPIKTICLAFFISFGFQVSNATESTVAITPIENSNETLAIFHNPIIKPKPKISIVIDDLGDNSIIAKQLIHLPVSLTLAILPQTPFAKLIAEQGNSQNHEVIMHLPMEALSRPDLLGPGALFSDMSYPIFLQTFLDDAQSIPHLIGFNNHMGSLLTQDSEKMQWLMTMAQQRNWFFLDSKTTGDSIAQTIAKEMGLPTISRDIFLDHHYDKADLPIMLENQLIELKRIARLRGHVVVICHPYQETLDFLTLILPELTADFDLVHLSELIKRPKVKVATKNN